MAEGGDEESGEEEDNEAEGDLCGDQSIQGALECGSSPPLGAVTGWMAEERTAGASPKSSVTARVRSEPKARIMTETRTAPPEIMWRERWNVHARGSLLDNVPDRLF